MDCVHTLYRPPQNVPDASLSPYYYIYCIIAMSARAHVATDPYYFRRISPIFRNAARLRRGNWNRRRLWNVLKRAPREKNWSGLVENESSRGKRRRYLRFRDGKENAQSGSRLTRYDDPRRTVLIRDPTCRGTSLVLQCCYLDLRGRRV